MKQIIFTFLLLTAINFSAIANDSIHLDQYSDTPQDTDSFIDEIYIFESQEEFEIWHEENSEEALFEKALSTKNNVDDQESNNQENDNYLINDLTYSETDDGIVIEIKKKKSSRNCIANSGGASWYGPGFHGNRTANGESFNQNDLTAAHKTLKFGSKVKVTYRGKSVIVRINDAGPFVRGRVIDLSKAAAQKIGLIASGHGQVQLEVVSCG